MTSLEVVEEIDEKKFDEKNRLREVARSLLSWLEGLLPEGGCGPVPLGGPDDSTVEILLAPIFHEPS